MADKVKVTLVKSTIGAIPKQRATVEALGLKKIGKTVELPNNDATKGMIWHVRHLVKVEEQAAMQQVNIQGNRLVGLFNL